VTEPPRLLVAANRFHPAVGGAEKHARRLHQEIGDRMRVDVVTLANRNGETRWLRLLIDGERDREERYVVDGRQVRALPRWPAPVRARLRLLAPGYHLPRSPVPAMMAGLLEPWVRPYLDGADVVHNPFMGREAVSLAFLRAAQQAAVPFVFTPHRHQRPLGWSSPAFRRLYRESAAVIALTEHEAAWLERRGASADRLHVIGVGPLNDPAASPEPAWRALGGRCRFVLFLGQLHEYKGFRAVLDAARRMSSSELRFVFVGPDLRAAATAFAGAPASVTYLGAVDDGLRDSLLAACDAVCVPSSRESFGGVVVEAWWAGKPVVAGSAPATRELVEDGVDGWSVPQDGSAIADRLKRLEAEPKLGLEMGERGRAKVERRWSWPRIAEAHLAVFERVMARREVAAR
jgi:glycosyltransferase involved in cell wall biosynthesis